MNPSNAVRPVRCGILLLGLSACLVARPAISQRLQPTHDDLTYATAPTDSGADKDLRLDLWLPQVSADKSPLVLWIHGGGWSGGSHDNPPAGLTQLLQRGFAVASVEYRLSGEAIAPAQIHDVKGAVRYLRANAAQYHLDPNRFAAWGSSAGGHLAALLATSGDIDAAEGDIGGNLDQSSAVQAAVDYFGPTHLLTMELDDRDPPGSVIDHDAPNSPESRLIGYDGPGEGIGDLRANIGSLVAPYPEKARLTHLMSPLAHVSSDDAPIYIAHGDLDTSVPILQSMRLAAALDSAGVENVFRRVEGAGHGFGTQSPIVNSEAIDFLASRLLAAPEPLSAALVMLGCSGLGVARSRAA
ncbi:alpha/beta hydrolase [Pseudobythopirellula maris]|uniref:alpha/beta hydrolase n=1 Tax=Pseudobythopirellula maris TaxID=2527991 RepID=UPI0018D2DC76|nr:alpha/beta hydrolase [Pseudobythopirellula maris]